MKTILVDCVNCFIDKEGNITEELHQLLETFPNKKIVLTSANDEQYKMFQLEKVPYELFTLKHTPEKQDPEYYKTMLDKYGLKAEDVVYIEHAQSAIDSAKILGITCHFFDWDTKDVAAVKVFLDENV